VSQELFDTLLEPVFIVNEQSKIIYCNEPAALLTGLSVKKISRSQPGLSEILKFNEVITEISSLASVTEPTAYKELGFSKPDGDTGRAQITIQPFPTTEAKSWIIFFRDVTLEETLQKKYRAELQQKEDVISDLQKAKAELQNYSKNLEKMVDERTQEVKALNVTMTALLDSLNQGFFIFDQSGKCLPVFSKACLSLLETDPSGKNIWDVLHMKPHQIDGFKKWISTLFMEMLPFEDLAPLGPQSIPHSLGRSIRMQYYPLKIQDQMQQVVVVATDITDLVHAQQESEIERAKSKNILQLIQFKSQALRFIAEGETLLADISSQLKSQSALNYNDLFINLHTLKGGAATFSAQTLVINCHAAETALSDWHRDQTAESLQSLNQKCDQVSQAFNSFIKDSEIILGSAERRQQKWIEVAADEMKTFLWNQTGKPEILENFESQFLTEPIEKMFSHFDDSVQQLALQENKKINNLVFLGGDLKVAPQPYQPLLGSLIHVYKNSADHGIESSEKRWESGKPEAGSITTVFQKTNHDLLIKITDDGGGISPAIVRKKLDEKQINHSAESDEQVIYHIFDENFSTKGTVNTTSGRGVGMGAVLVEVKKLGGTLQLKSQTGKGTEILITVPYFSSLLKSQKAA
jgi:two-component system chemotaxis sensor kinase CheA